MYKLNSTKTKLNKEGISVSKAQHWFNPCVNMLLLEAGLHSIIAMKQQQRTQLSMGRVYRAQLN